MDRAGSLEVLMPALQPPEIWQQSGRYETAREVFFKVRDRARKEWILGPTHEEVMTTLMSSELSSYRQLPKSFYQIQTKFRDEIRPRFGLMRAKEFLMKDAYSFDASDAAAQISYQKMYDAYVRIFQRCGLKAIAVDADTGVMGGKFSHEFMVPAGALGRPDVEGVQSCWSVPAESRPRNGGASTSAAMRREPRSLAPANPAGPDGAGVGATSGVTGGGGGGGGASQAAKDAARVARGSRKVGLRKGTSEVATLARRTAALVAGGASC